ncbi:MAG: HAD hydrolase-like protein [Deltaproteobacteria bacterium]|nr:HAD hydrolase-like protein [Deltaproteobacteria bacterium]MBI3294665.1 HAD hydrolase-like protein [Deltaproteobacteria bacterium]
MPARAFLFDLDGTLINTLPDIVGVVNRVREEFGLKARPTPEVAVFIGRGAEHLIAGCFQEVLGTSTVTAVISQFRARYYAEPHHGGHLYEGVEETLRKLKKMGFKVGIATNKPERAAHVTLNHYLPNFVFDIIAAPENVPTKKPSGVHLTTALQALGVRPEDAHFAGDDPVDLAAAAEAGVKFYGISFGFGGVQAPLMLKRFPELLDYLERIK